MKCAVVFTIGYGGRRFNGLVGDVVCVLHELQKGQAGLHVRPGSGGFTIADVRRFPTSKADDFKQDRLLQLCSEAGLGYVHFEALGGFRKGGYVRYMSTENWKKEYAKLLKVVNERCTVLLCKEVDPRYCHRRFLAEKLYKDGYEVTHILRGKNWKSHREIFSTPIF